MGSTKWYISFLTQPVEVYFGCINSKQNLVDMILNCFTDLDVCKICLKKQEGVLYKYNIQHVKILDLAFESSIDLGQWDDARLFGTELIEGYR